MSNSRHKLAASVRSPARGSASATAAPVERKGVDFTAMGFSRSPTELKGTERSICCAFFKTFFARSRVYAEDDPVVHAHGGQPVCPRQDAGGPFLRWDSLENAVACFLPCVFQSDSESADTVLFLLKEPIVSHVNSYLGRIYLHSVRSVVVRALLNDDLVCRPTTTTRSPQSRSRPSSLPSWAKATPLQRMPSAKMARRTSERCANPCFVCCADGDCLSVRSACTSTLIRISIAARPTFGAGLGCGDCVCV
jgi:hypothetical protein